MFSLKYSNIKLTTILWKAFRNFTLNGKINKDRMIGIYEYYK